MTDTKGATSKVYRGILQGLETNQLVPGQRLVESELAAQFGVGRNAVREAMQHLAARGVVDLSRHRSAAIRQLDLAETLEILDVVEVMIQLLMRAAALRYQAEKHRNLLPSALVELKAAHESEEPGAFSRARRRFYRILLAIGGNREMKRLFPAIGMHIIYAKYQSRRLQALRIADYGLIIKAVASGDAAKAAAVGRQHLKNVREAILVQSKPALP